MGRAPVITPGSALQRSGDQRNQQLVLIADRQSRWRLLQTFGSATLQYVASARSVSGNRTDAHRLIRDHCGSAHWVLARG
jgi:hypothetical protein